MIQHATILYLTDQKKTSNKFGRNWQEKKIGLIRLESKQGFGAPWWGISERLGLDSRLGKALQSLFIHTFLTLDFKALW